MNMWNLSIQMMLLFLFLCIIAAVSGIFKVPDATVEVYHPRGFKISIPDVPGIKSVTFHGKINEGSIGEKFSGLIREATNGSWVFDDEIIKLKPGDILYYWTFVKYYDGDRVSAYPRSDQVFVVKEENINKRPIQTETLFFEDFSSNSLNSTRWTVEQKFAGEPDYEFVMYVNRQKTIQVKNNKLRIKPVLTRQIFGEGFLTSLSGYDFGKNCTADAFDTLGCKRDYNGGFLLPPVMSAQISTKKKFSFKYGKVEIRAKLPVGDFIYPEIYLNPLYKIYGHSNYESGQIRIAFFGNTKKEFMFHDHLLRGGIILGQSNAAREYGMITIETINQKWSDDFHNFVVNWQPDDITFSVDDKICGRIVPPSDGFAKLANKLQISNGDKLSSGSKLAPFDQEMYLVLGVGVGGFNFGDSIIKPWKNGKRNMVTQFNNAENEWFSTWSEKSVLKVDYIRVTKN